MNNKVEEGKARFLTAALADLQVLVEEFTIPERMEIVQKLDHEVQYLARIAVYLEARGGCGKDKGHDVAVKEQNRVVAKIREALGFDRPRMDVSF